MYYAKYVVRWWLLPLCCEYSFVVIVGFAPKVGRCMVHTPTAPCSGCVCGPSWRRKKIWKFFFLLQEGREYSKGRGELGGGWDKDEFCSSVCYDFETWNFFFLKRERGTGCEGEVNRDESVCLFVFNGSYVSVSFPVVLCEQGLS